MRSIHFIFSLFICALMIHPPAKAEDLSGAVLQKQIAELQDSMRLLHGTVLELKQTVQIQNVTIKEQSAKIQMLEGAGTGQVGSEKSTPTPKTTLFSVKGLQGINPEIGLAGTTQAMLTENNEDGEGRDTIALKELELSVAQYVDPYSRLDAIFAFNDNLEDQNVDIEEAYYSHWGLPLGFQTQLGKFRSKIGKQNLVHLHALETADYALVIQDFFGEEGLASSGVRLQNTVPNPWDIPLELTGEVLRGNNGNSFSGVSRRPIFNTHIKTFFELSEDADMELGWTTLFGDENPARFSEVNENGEEVNARPTDGSDKYGVKVYGADLTFNFRLPEGKTVKWQNELYFQNRGTLVHPNDNPWGFYTLLDYRFSERFSTGLRFDYLEPLGVQGGHHQTIGVSPYITFWQSEFANFRLQYSHTEPASADAKQDNAVYLSANFMIGSHKHPVQ